MAVFNYDGKQVSVNDRVSVLGYVTAVSGTGGSATVTFQPLHSNSTISVKGNDANAPQTDGVVTSISGKGYGLADRATVLGFVTAISGVNLVITLESSGASVTVPAASVRSAA